VNVEDRRTQPLYWDASGMTGTKSKARVKIRAVMSPLETAGGFTKAVETEVNKDLGGVKDAQTEIGPGSVDLLTGAFTVSRTDVAIPNFSGSLEFARSINSREAGAEANGVLGPGWKPGAPIEEAAGSSWRSLTIESSTEYLEPKEEGEAPEAVLREWAELRGLGGDMSFPIDPDTKAFKTPPEATGALLYRLGSTEIALTDAKGTRTVFSNGGLGSEYRPISIAMTGGNKARMIYELTGKNRRLHEVIAPAAAGIVCTDTAADRTPGCHALRFNYVEGATVWGMPSALGFRLKSITYYAPGNGGPWTVAEYSYNTEGRLVAEWDPRISPALEETYTYESSGQLKTLKPAGQEPWTMEYGAIVGDAGLGRLVAVKRPSLVGSEPTARRTIAYNVPLAGASGPYAMTPQDVAAWGQTDVPVDATAIFPPNEVPSSPPAAYTRATVYYMDAEGQVSNRATPTGAVEAPSITTTETDRFGNISRELSAQNRLEALKAGTGSVAKAEELDTRFHYSADGTELQVEEGPTHLVRLQSGETTPARFYRSIQYDRGAPEPGPGEPMPELPTSEESGALVKGKVLDERATVYEYDWNLRQQTESITDPAGPENPDGLNIRSFTKYNEAGQPLEVRQPSEAEAEEPGKGAGTRKTTYYVPELEQGKGNLSKCESSTYAGLPCKIEPAAQPVGSGAPQLLVKKFLSYNHLGEPTEFTESPGGGLESLRTTTLAYDAAGRKKTKKITGGGGEINKVETLYSSINGMPTVERFLCGGSESECASFDSQAITTAYDALGRPKSYEDADGNLTKVTYDLLGRRQSMSDNKGSQTLRYDPVSGYLVELQDSAVGTLTAHYDADGHITERTLPDGLSAKTTYNAAGEPMALAYTKASACGASCTWFGEQLERSVFGQVVLNTNSMAKDGYVYDPAGRIIEAQETPTGGSCTTRKYEYDSDFNRRAMFTRSPGPGGICVDTGGTKTTYSYDTADRLIDSGVKYDAWGRTTKLPAGDAGGKELTTSYFGNDMIAIQSQGGVTNTFQLDASLRQRQRLQGGGGLEGVEVFHYDGPGGTASWTQRGETWTRNITGIGGQLAAVQESGKEVTLQLTNLHGDVVATAALNPAETALKATYRFDEFGNPTAGSAGRFGWLGGVQQRTELPAGIVQIGARSYAAPIGRFLSSDPLAGGSANPYDYANADPLDQIDLSGEKPYDNACDRGVIGCQCTLHIKMWSPTHWRMGVRFIRQCNRVGGVDLHAWHLWYWVDEQTGYGFVEMSPPHYLNHYPGDPGCRPTDPCQNHWDHSGTFECHPGWEYQIGAEWQYTYNAGYEVGDVQTLTVKAQEFCF
jgi:RHS repeat-associated protein